MKGEIMSTSHPYVSGAGNVRAIIEQLRKNFPKKVTSETIKKFGIASNNESRIISLLQFIKVIEEDGSKIEKNASAFNQVDDDKFQKEFSKIVQESYSELFNLLGDGAWTASASELASFFRQTDKTSDTIGKWQTSVFSMLAALSGKAEFAASHQRKPSNKKKPVKSSKSKGSQQPSSENRPATSTALGSIVDSVGMSIKIDINLPADASKETYDNIFESIRKNLING